ncbi:phage antirepressor N-terminal domain-containing protein [Leptospirillum ferriphilum]|uniref:phage antirepressor N-terminal domain-containing protein n=1 Tax=Leptospirillum ferriphilum TaxID=178606 RepID=UPI0006B1E211|nr:phage antirepressor N-terminal domain-containing protein [Leptospirillum ferriphilum]
MNASSSALVPVPFHGNTLFLVERNNEPYTPMKPIVEGMGLAWHGQFQKLQRNSDRWTCIPITGIQVPGDTQGRETLCMPLRKLPGWLMTIQPSRVKPEIREKILLYQNECDDVLWEYWTKGRAEVDLKATVEHLSRRLDGLERILFHRFHNPAPSMSAFRNGLPYTSEQKEGIRLYQEMKKNVNSDAKAFIASEYGLLVRALFKSYLREKEAQGWPCFDFGDNSDFVAWLISEHPDILSIVAENLEKVLKQWRVR